MRVTFCPSFIVNLVQLNECGPNQNAMLGIGQMTQEQLCTRTEVQNYFEHSTRYAEWYENGDSILLADALIKKKCQSI